MLYEKGVESLIIDISIIAIYLIVILVIGMISSRKVSSISDFAVSNVKYGKTVIFITMCCSFLGGGFSFGNTAEVYKNGIGNIFALFGFSIGQILIGKYVANRMDKFSGCISTGSIIEKMYGKRMQILTGILSTIICSGILGAQVSVLGNIFEVFIGIPSYIGVIIGFGIVLIYSTMGGIKADIITDIIQFIILIIGMPVLLIFGLNHIGGINGLIQNVPIEFWDIFNNNGVISFFSLFITLMIGEMLVPPYVQRLLMGKNSKETSVATKMSGYASIPFFVITGTIGLIAYVYNSNIDPEYSMIFLIKNVLPVGISGIIVSSMMAIVLSTADSFLNSAAVGLINDVYIPLKKDNINEKERLKVVRITNLIIGIVSVSVALAIPSLIEILTFSYSFWAPTILPILLLTILDFKLKKIGAWFGIIVGIISVFIWNVALLKPYGIDGLIIGFVINIVTSIVITLIGNVIYIKIKR